MKMGIYDHILAKTADVQYKVLIARIGLANEANERNRLKRIELGLRIVDMAEITKVKLEALLQEDLDITDQANE